MMILYTAGMALLGFSGVILLSIPTRGRDVGFEDLGSSLFGIFILAMIASPWIANILLLQRVKRYLIESPNDASWSCPMPS